MTHTKPSTAPAGVTYEDLVKDLTVRQRAFVEAFTGNATQAAREAHYTGPDESLAVTGYKLLRNSKVRRAIQERGHDPSVRRIMNREEMQELWTSFADDESLDIADRMKATELLGKSQAMFTEKVVHEGTQRIEVVNPYPLEPGEKKALEAPTPEAHE